MESVQYTSKIVMWLSFRMKYCTEVKGPLIEDNHIPIIEHFILLSWLFADHGATIKWLCQGLWHQETPLEKANSCFRVELNPVRDYSLLIMPSFLTGVSIRFCSFEGANENVWHVLVRVTTGTTKFHLTVKFLIIAFFPMLILFSL